jgi:GNAT superfamily N-acetyltransferase
MGCINAGMDAVVHALSDHPELIPVAAGWHFQEWGHTDPAGSLESWTAALAGQAGANQVPRTLLALADGDPVGLVCLVARDVPGYEPAAGVKGLYVKPSARCQGHGQLLTRRCEEWAGSLGHDVLYLFTRRNSPAQALYENIGWQVVNVGRYEDIDVTVMRTDLCNAANLSSESRASSTRPS